MATRILLAKKYKNCTTEAWRSEVRISDELTFCCLRATRYRVRRPTNITKDYFRKLSDSLPKKTRMVIQAKGDITKYGNCVHKE